MAEAGSFSRSRFNGRLFKRGKVKRIDRLITQRKNNCSTAVSSTNDKNVIDLDNGSESDCQVGTVDHCHDADCQVSTTPDVLPREGPFPIEGRRVVDIQFFAQRLFCLACRTPLLMCNISGELIRGLGGWIFIDCSACSYNNRVPLGKTHSDTDVASATCTDNQYIQKRTKHAFDVNTKSALGYGVFAKVDIFGGSFLGCYPGELISESEGRDRELNYPGCCGSFLYFFRGRNNKQLCIDATNADGISNMIKFVNDGNTHPNARMRLIDVDGQPYLCLFALGTLIRKGQEVTYDYGPTEPNMYWRKVRALLDEQEMSASKMLKEKVFGIMRRDDVGILAQKDPLIVKLGDIWLSKSIDNKLRRYTTASFRMRLAARVLIKARLELDEPQLSIKDLITPDNFDTVCHIAIELCSPEYDDLKHPSVALKVGYDFARLAGLKMVESTKGVRTDEKQLQKLDSMDFLEAMKLQWATKVSKFAHVAVREHRFDNRRELPHPKDIATLASELLERLSALDLTSQDQYSCVVKLVLPRLMLYNRRRCGEIESLTLSSFRKRSTKLDDVEEAILGELTVLEKYLQESQEIVWIRGKRGKAVPVLFPADVKEALMYLADPEVRKQGGVKPESPYLFANTGYGVMKAYKCLQDLCFEVSADLIHQSRLTSTGYRAYMATIAQCIALQPNQVQWVCDHLGHTEDVHKTHYRHTLGGIERIQLGKLLLLQDKNLVGKYQNKALDEIQFEDIVTILDSQEPPVRDQLDEDVHMVQEEENLDIQEVHDVDLADLEQTGLIGGKQAKKKAGTGARTPWTPAEMRELGTHAAQYLKKRKTPSRIECAAFIEASKAEGGELQRRTPALIVKKISALNMKAKKTC